MLFKKLPDDIFRPLAGANRHSFEKILKHLYALFFNDEDGSTDAPRRDVVLGEIKTVLLEEESINLWDEDGRSDNVYRDADTAAPYAMRRLIETGWLDEEEDGHFTKNIVPTPGGRMLMEALLGIESQQKRSYGQTVTAIRSNIEVSISHPEEYGVVFIEAVSKTKEFSGHLRGILYSLKEVQENLSKLNDPKRVLANFFEQFVENILIADYKTLLSADNPFRHRNKINILLAQAQHMDATFQGLVEAYMSHYGIESADEASGRLTRDIEYIRNVFNAISPRLDRIDHFRFQLERRVEETVRYIDRSMPGMTNRLSALMAELQKTCTAKDAHELEAPPAVSQTTLLSQFSIYTPSGRKERPTGQILRELKVNPDVKFQRELVREYMRKRAVNPLRVVNYLSAQMGEKAVMSASEFQVADVDDLVSFLLIRHLRKLKGRGQQSARAFHVARQSDTVTTEWVTCQNFIVERHRDAL